MLCAMMYVLAGAVSEGGFNSPLASMGTRKDRMMERNTYADAQWRLETEDEYPPYCINCDTIRHDDECECTSEDDMNYYFYNTITEKWEPVPDNNNDVQTELQDRTDELHAEEPIFLVSGDCMHWHEASFNVLAQLGCKPSDVPNTGMVSRKGQFIKKG